MEQQSQSAIPGLSLTEALDKRRNEVWHAVDQKNGRSVAVKLLNPAYESIVPKRFGRRSRALAKILRTTPGWVPLLGHGTARDGRQYVMTPYYRSGSLADQLVHGRTPWYPAASLVMKVATTIGGAHSKGWPFGRLRPSNVLLEQADNPLIVIYGSATRRFDDGTAEFTAPEVTSGQDPVPASDVYSLTLILASLIAGREVDGSERVSSILSEVAGQVPERIVEIIDYGLSPSLRNRYANAAKMSRALAVALSDPHHGGTSAATIGDEAGTEADQGINPLDALLAEPLIATHDQPPGGASPSPSAGPNGAAGLANNPEHPAALRDLSISRLPRSIMDRSVERQDYLPTGDGEADTEPPWIVSDDDTGPTDQERRLDDPTANPFAAQHGPLSDLLGPSAAPASSVDEFDPDPTIDISDASETRREIIQLIDKLGLDGDSRG